MIDHSSASPLGEGIVWEDQLPLRWEAVDDVTALPLTRWNEENESVLRLLNGLGDHSGSEHSEDSEIHRLEFKTNLLLELVGELLALQNPPPPALSVKLSGQGIQWQSADASSAAAFVLTLYMNPHFPRALRFAGIAAPAMEPGWLGARYHGFSPAVQDAMEKLIFRHHRRAIALAQAARQAHP